MLVVLANKLQESGLNPENMSCVQVLEKMVSVAWILGITGEHKGQTSLFWQGEYKNKGHNPKSLSWVPVLVKMVPVGQ
jgi:hypothetical protein